MTPPVSAVAVTEPRRLEGTSGYDTYEYPLPEPAVLTGPFKALTVNVTLPEIGGRRRRMRVRFSPESRPALSGEWSLSHGITDAERRNADGRWWLKLICETDAATGTVTVTAVQVTHLTR